MDVEGAEVEEVEIEGVYFEVKGVEMLVLVEGVHFEVKGRRLRRCSLRSKERRWRLRWCSLGLRGGGAG